MVPAARRAGRRGGALRRSDGAEPTGSRSWRSSSPQSSRSQRRAARPAQARADAAGFPRRPGVARKRPLGVASVDACPAGSTRSPTRRAASARRRPRSTSPPASRRPASARSSSTSTRRRTRPRGSASARTEARPSTCSTAIPLPQLARPTRFATSISSRRSPTSRAPRWSSRAAATASATWPTRSPAQRTTTRSCSSTARPRSGPLTVNALAAADRVLVPVQAEYYALEGLAQLVRLGRARARAAQPEPRARRRAADDGRRAHAARRRRRRRGAPALRRARLPRVGAALGARRGGAEPRPARDRLRPRARAGADAYWKVAMELVGRS